jgi:type VI secretion system (T6SS) baseplate-like injector VgrG
MPLAEQLEQTDVRAVARYYGKYRGTVINNIDPMQIGRIQAMVPDISNYVPTSWAMPCLPVGGIQMGIFSVPIIGAGVWIEFEHGDPDHPIWTGCFWGSAAEIPATALLSPPPIPAITLQTPLQNGIIISDNPAIGITIKTATGAMIMVTDLGITISNGKGAIMTMIGPTTDINATALTII